MTEHAQTPWGQSDRETVIAEGIVFYSTPSHGGFRLSDERMSEMPADFRESTFVPDGRWYEEDCDAAKVVVTFRQHFGPDELKRADAMVAWISDNAA